MIVVDASALVAAIVQVGPHGMWVEAEIARGDLAAPEFVLAEWSNTLRRLELRGDVSTTAAAIAYGDLLDLDLNLFPFAPYAQRVWALRNNLTSYDAWYVALAEALDCPLVTLDGRLGRAAGPACTFILPPSA